MNNAQKISEYLQIAKRIEAMENALSMKESELKNQFNNSYERLKRDLNGYLGKIKPTVETVCSIYKTKATLSNGRIALCDGIYKAEYTPLNACEVAVRLGNESIKLLAMIVGKNNVDANLIHEAAIGKIAGEQLNKLMTLGLSEKEAEQAIINGFLK